MAGLTTEKQDDQPARRSSTRDAALAFALYLLIALALTYPLALGLGTTVLGTPGDNLEYVWKVWRFRHLLAAGQSPFGGGGEFAAWSYSALNDETSLAQLAPSLALSRLFGSISAYNILVLASFPLAGLAMWMLVMYFTGTRAAALLAGAVYAFCPYHVVHAQGHLPLMGLYWIPLVFLALERTLKKRSGRWALAAGLFYSLAALSSWYYAYICGGFAALYALIRARQLRRKVLGRTALRLALVAAMPAAVLVAPLAAATWLALGQQSLRHGVSAFIIYSASPLDFVGGSPWQVVWGSWVRRLIGPGEGLAERCVFVGLVPLALAFVGLGRRRKARLYVLMVALGALMALGPVLQWRGKPVAISISRPQVLRSSLQSAVQGLARISGRSVPADIAELRAVPVPMPALAAIVALPGFGSLRAIARFGLMAILGISVLAAFGLTRLTSGAGHRKRWALAGILLCAALFEFWPSAIPVYRPRPSGADLWLAKQPGDFVIAALPAARNTDGQILYGAMYHHKRLLGGRATLPPRGFDEAMRLLDELPSPAAVEFLRRSGVRCVVAYGDAGSRLEGSADFALAWRGDDQQVYRLVKR